MSKLLRPVIREEVETAIQAGLTQIQEEMAKNIQRITETEQRISTLEDDLLHCQVCMQTAEKPTNSLADKLDDLENRSRRNNCGLWALPEIIKAAKLSMICKRDIPKALELE